METPTPIARAEAAVPAEQELEPAATGPAAAVTLAAAIGILVLGIVTTLSEASSSIGDSLQWNDRVGPLSGKTIVASAAFLASWGALGTLWRRTCRTCSSRRAGRRKPRSSAFETPGTT